MITSLQPTGRGRSQAPVAGAGGGVITVGCGRRGLTIIVGSALALTLAVPLIVAFAARF
jgi:hypothetical protein